MLMALTFWTLFFSYLMSTVATAGAGYGREAEADRVTNLPAQPPVKFRHYAGYVKLSPHEEKALFYWFFEAQESPKDKPLVLWLNGGPSCSSVSIGAVREIGPFLVQVNGSLKLNKHSWNKVANIIFLESPIGVGFSYTNNSKDILKLGDRVTAIDNYAFLVGWLKKFPSFRSHDFYIAGESYAGHYVPQLADLIYKGNKHANNKGFHINFKGFMVGNAAINDLTDKLGLIDYAWSHAIVSDRIYYGLRKDCDFRKDNQTKVCNSHIVGFMKSIVEIDIFSIYSPVCLQHYKKALPPKLVTPRFVTPHDLLHTLPSGYDPCLEDHLANYFNNKEVQKALHANVTNLSYPYSPCSLINVKWNDSPKSVLPIIQKLLRAGLNIWIYSGDTDGRVPVTSTRYSIKKMGLKVKKEWRPWFDKHQVAGWTEVYEGNLTFVTIKGAGHEVPVYKPQQALSLFSHFLSSKPLSSSRF